MFLIDTREPDLIARNASLYQGDAIEVLHSLPAGTVDLTVTSPPYLLGKQYGDEQDDDYDYAQYLRWSRSWLQALYRATSDGGRLCLNVPLDTRRKGVARPFYAELMGELLRPDEDGLTWNYQTTIVWNEGTINRRTAWGSYARPSAPCVTSAVEVIVVAYKGDAWVRKPEGRTWDIEPEEFKAWTITPWDVPNRNAGNKHPAPFCLEIPRRLIKLYSYCEDVICDPFVGSGTTCLAAERLGRSSIGIDLEREWLDLAVERIERDGVVTDLAGTPFVQPALEASA